MPGFGLQKLRLQSMVTLTFPCLMVKSLCLWSYVHKKQQPGAFHPKPKLFKTTFVLFEEMEDVLRRYTVSDNVILSLIICTLFMWQCCPCHYSTGTIPVPFASGGGGHQGGPGAPGSSGALEFLPAVFNHKQNLWHKSKFTAARNICCINYSCFVFSHRGCWLDPKLFVWVFLKLSCCWDTNPFKRAS